MTEITASPIEWSYLAGIFDGEGCVWAVESKPGKWNVSPRFRMFAKVTNTSEKLMNWISERFGGTIHIAHRPGEWKATRTCYIVLWSPCKAEIILHGMYPYLTVKKDQADLAFRLRAVIKSRDPHLARTGRGYVLTNETISERRGLLASLRNAKKVA